MMPDISMCKNRTCKLSEMCYRHPDSGTEPSEFRQAWNSFISINPEGSELTYCDHYWARGSIADPDFGGGLKELRAK